MLARWTRYMPYAFVVWYAKRRCELIPSRHDGWQAVDPYRGEVLMWRTPAPRRGGEG